MENLWWRVSQAHSWRPRSPMPNCRWRCPQHPHPCLPTSGTRTFIWTAFRLLELAIPLVFLFTGLGARLRRMCESISGRRWFWTVTLFVCAYLILAAPASA
jgi:hypothetical protein